MSQDPSPPEPPRKPWWRRKRTWFRLAMVPVAGLLLVFLTVAGSVIWVRSGADGHLYSEQDVPAAPVGLVLGAQVYSDGTPSPFLAARLDLARRLFVAGKVRVLLVSGDNGRPNYDEPSAMRAWLIANGVPDKKIVRDYAGFDTYDSCDRAIRIFGVHQAIVVTQTFHLPRAVMLCRRLGLDASGVGDDSVKKFSGPWRSNSTREYGACVKAVFDVASGRDPVYLGRHETAVDDALRDG
jgi:vancomycin permeability regulator SanA